MKHAGLLAAIVLFAGCGGTPLDDAGVRKHLYSPRWEDRAWAARAIGDASETDLQTLLLLAQTDAAPGVRASALLAIDRLAPEEGYVRLASAVRDPKEHESVRAAAAIALGRHSRPLVADTLVDGLDDRSRPVREACATGLRRAFPMSVLRERYRVALAEAGTAVERAQAVRRIALLRDRDAAAGVTALLDDPAPAARAAAVEAHARLALPLADETRGALLGDPDATVRAKAAALANEPEADALRFDDDPGVRLAARIRLAALRDVPWIPPYDATVESVDDVLVIGSRGDAVVERSIAMRVDRLAAPVDSVVLPLPPATTRAGASANGVPVPVAIVGGEGELTLAAGVRPSEAGARLSLAMRFELAPLVERDRTLLYDPGTVVATRSSLTIAGSTVSPLAARRVALDPAVDPARIVRPRRAWDATIAGLLAATLVAIFGIGAARAWQRGQDEWALLILGAGATVLFLSPHVVEDNACYLGWARSLALGKDLVPTEDFFLRNGTGAFAPDPLTKWAPVGASMFWAPVFFVLRGEAWTRASLYAVQLLAAALVVASWVLSYRMARARVSRGPALAGVLAMAFGTHALLFQAAWTGSSHAPAIFLATLFLYCLDGAAPSRSRFLLAGLAGGLLVAVRPQFALFVPIAAVPLAQLSRTSPRRDAAWAAAALVVGLLAGYLPQLAAAAALDGAAVPESYGAFSGRIAPVLSRIVPLLFGGGREPLLDPPARPFAMTGLLTAMPVVVPAAIGVVLASRRELFARAWLAAAAIQLLVLVSYPVWWGRLLFATPYLAPLFAIGSCGTAVFLERVPAGRARALATALLAACCVPALRASGYELAHRASSLPLGKTSLAAMLSDAVLLPDRVVEAGALRRHGEIAAGVRALFEHDPRRVLAWIAATIAMLALARAALALRERVKRDAITLALLALTLGGSAALTVKGRRTDLERADVPLTRMRDAYEVAPLFLVRPGEMRSQRIGGAAAHTITLVAFTTGATAAPDGTIAAAVLVELEDGGVRTADLVFGTNIADLEVCNPAAHAAHAIPRDAEIQQRVVRDASESSYVAGAYRADLAVDGRVRSVSVQSRLDHGHVWVTAMLLRGPEPTPGWRERRPGRYFP